jgi:hypothetical protein
MMDAVSLDIEEFTFGVAAQEGSDITETVDLALLFDSQNPHHFY